MLACDETVTLVRHILEQEGDRYACTVIRGVSWHTAEWTTLQEHGFVKKRETKARIPENCMLEGVIPEAGDWMIRGAVTEIAEQSDLEAWEHIRIMTVGDNRRGGLPHWAVTGQ